MMENINLIRKIAWGFHETTGIEWDDLFQEAAYAYLKSLESYDPRKGALTTHAWHCISNHLKNYLKEELKQTGHLEYYDRETLSLLHLETHSPTFLDSLTMDAREIAKLVFTTPRKYVALTLEEVENRTIRIMVHNGWGVSRVISALVNLETICSTE